MALRPELYSTCRLHKNSGCHSKPGNPHECAETTVRIHRKTMRAKLRRVFDLRGRDEFDPTGPYSPQLRWKGSLIFTPVAPPNSGGSATTSVQRPNSYKSQRSLLRKVALSLSQTRLSLSFHLCRSTVSAVLPQIGFG